MPLQNMTSGMLTPSENYLVFSLLGEENRSLSTVVAQLWTTQGNNKMWTLVVTGVACLVKDFTRKGYFIQVFDMDKLEQIWEQELYYEMDYKTGGPKFHYFETESGLAGLAFAAPEEAIEFKDALELRLNIWKERSKQRLEKFLNLTGLNETFEQDEKSRSSIIRFVEQNQLLTTLDGVLKSAKKRQVLETNSGLVARPRPKPTKTFGTASSMTLLPPPPTKKTQPGPLNTINKLNGQNSNISSGRMLPLLAEWALAGSSADQILPTDEHKQNTFKDPFLQWIPPLIPQVNLQGTSTSIPSTTTTASGTRTAFDSSNEGDTIRPRVATKFSPLLPRQAFVTFPHLDHFNQTPPNTLLPDPLVPQVLMQTKSTSSNGKLNHVSQSGYYPSNSTTLQVNKTSSQSSPVYTSTLPSTSQIVTYENPRKYNNEVSVAQAVLTPHMTSSNPFKAEMVLIPNITETDKSFQAKTFPRFQSPFISARFNEQNDHKNLFKHQTGPKAGGLVGDSIRLNQNTNIPDKVVPPPNYRLQIEQNLGQLQTNTMHAGNNSSFNPAIVSQTPFTINHQSKLSATGTSFDTKSNRNQFARPSAFSQNGKPSSHPDNNNFPNSNSSPFVSTIPPPPPMPKQQTESMNSLQTPTRSVPPNNANGVETRPKIGQVQDRSEPLVTKGQQPEPQINRGSQLTIGQPEAQINRGGQLTIGQPGPQLNRGGLLEEIQRRGGVEGAGLRPVDIGRAAKTVEQGDDLFGLMQRALQMIQDVNCISDSSDAESTGSWSEEEA